MPDGVDHAAVAHVIEMNIEIGFQAFLVAAGLIEVGVGLGLIRKTARHHVDVKIDAKIFRIAALEPQRGALRLDDSISWQAPSCGSRRCLPASHRQCCRRRRRRR